jgi:hypothetical protein
MRKDETYYRFQVVQQKRVHERSLDLIQYLEIASLRMDEKYLSINLKLSR